GAEPGAERRVGGDVAVHHLHRHLTAQRLVQRPPDLPHPAGRDAGDQPVSAAENRVGVHRPSTACMTSRAIGAATAPPVASLPALPDSTMTATATLGSSAGAKQMNQACEGWPGPVSAVPVLPATVIPGTCAARPVPCCTTPTIILVSSDRKSTRL